MAGLSVDLGKYTGNELSRSDDFCRQGSFSQYTSGCITTNFWMMVVAILGTTISPYLFFWQAAQEIEDAKADPKQAALIENPREEKKKTLARIQIDTLVGMGFSNLVALAILVTGAAVLQSGGVSGIESAAQAAEALRPIAGNFAFAIFAIPIIGTGLLSIPVLAGSAAYAVGEANGCSVGLTQQPLQAKACYGAIAAATLLGAAANVFGLNSVKALVWSAILNGIVAVPVMVLRVLMSTIKKGVVVISYG